MRAKPLSIKSCIEFEAAAAMRQKIRIDKGNYIFDGQKYVLKQGHSLQRRWSFTGHSGVIWCKMGSFTPSGASGVPRLRLRQLH